MLRLIIVALLICSWAQAEQERTPELRAYSAGPLKRDDFRGKPDYSASGQAYTDVQVKFNYELDLQRDRRGIEARLVSLTAHSFFMPQSSWWKLESTDPQLLDHEQGHFDIAEICAQRVQLTFAKSIAKGRGLTGRGTSKQDAIEKLKKKIDQVMELANRQTVEQSKEYDAMTRHGIMPREQSEMRRVQKATLQKLVSENKKLARRGRSERRGSSRLRSRPANEAGP